MNKPSFCAHCVEVKLSLIRCRNPINGREVYLCPKCKRDFFLEQLMEKAAENRSTYFAKVAERGAN